jgi:hypothetical protein
MKKRILILFGIIILISLIGYFVMADNSFKNINKFIDKNIKFSEVIKENYTDAPYLDLKVIKKDGFEKDINLKIIKINETRFKIYYEFNATVLKEIKSAESKGDKNKELDKIKAKYKDISNKDFSNSINSLSDYPKESTKKIKTEGKIDLNNFGFFYVDLVDYDKNNIKKLVGEKIKIGYNSVEIQVVESSAFSVGDQLSIGILDHRGTFPYLYFPEIIYIPEFSVFTQCEGDMRGNTWTCITPDLISTAGGESTSVAMGIYMNATTYLFRKDYYTHYDSLSNNLRTCIYNTGSEICYNITGGGTGSGKERGYYFSTAQDVNHNLYVALSLINTTYDNVLQFCNGTDDNWDCEIVSENNTGYYPAIAIDSSGITHIVSVNFTTIWISQLIYCNNTGGTWGCIKLPEAELNSTQIMTPSIDIDSNDIIHIAYSDGGYLGYCNNTGGDWSCMEPDSIGVTNVVGISPSISTDQFNKVHIVHIDNTNNVIRYCNDLNYSWNCTNLVYDYNDSEIDHLSNRWMTIKKGRIVDSTSYLNKIAFAYPSYSNPNYIVNYAEYNPYIFNFLNKPLNSTTYGSTIVFNCSAISYVNDLTNTTIYIWNSTSDLINTSTFGITGAGIYNESTFSYTFTNAGDYYWNCLSYNNLSLSAESDSNITFMIDLFPPIINIQAPPNWIKSNQNVYFNFTATDSEGLDTCQLWTNTTGTWEKNYTWIYPNSGVMNFTTLNISTNNSKFKYNAWCNDTVGNGVFNSTNFTFSLDTVLPYTRILSPANGSTISGAIITFNHTYTELHPSVCRYIVINSTGSIEVNNVSTSCNDGNVTFAVSRYGTYSINFTITDLAGNFNSSKIYVTTYQTSSGGGGGSTIITITENVTINRTLCGDGICQFEGNDFGVKEDYWNCQADCPGAIGENLDNLVYFITKYCFDKDPETLCFWTQGFSVSVQDRIKAEEEKNKTICGDSICQANENPFSCEEDCGKFSTDMFFNNCKGKDNSAPCFWKMNLAIYIGLGMVGIFVVIWLIKNKKKWIK